MNSSIYKFDFLCYIGRFQPFHRGHLDVIKKSLDISDNLIIVMGSHERPCELKNPFSSIQRRDIIWSALTDDQLDRITICYQNDHTYNEEKWLASIQAQVNTAIMHKWTPDAIKVGIVGYNKDHSSFYLKKFPQWDLVEIKPEFPVLNATDFRNILFCEWSESRRIEASSIYWINNDHHRTVMDLARPIHTKMRYEQDFLNHYRQQWGPGPFVTADALVTQAGHLLVIERGPEYGGGLWALPGGFVNPKETFRDAVLRELFEETQIDVPKPVLNGSICNTRIFDDPDRSSRGRIITQCSHFKLNDMYDLPKIRGSDDAAKAFWIPLSTFVQSRDKFFEDHFSVIEAMLGM
jgi:bifunctional NMN adenylyltransferase/nudix hydrolase